MNQKSDKDDRPIENYNIKILRDGVWLHNDTPINRRSLVKLFSTVLKKDEHGDYWLITPAERGRVVVEDVPFLAVEVMQEGEGRDQNLIFRTNLDDEVLLGPDHPLKMRADSKTGDLIPYIDVRDGLEARFTRALYYDIANMLTAGPQISDQKAAGNESMGLWSNNAFFPLMETSIENLQQEDTP